MSSVSRNSTPKQWDEDRVRALVEKHFNVRPCHYQIKTALALYAGKDVVGCTPTGAGKTLSFWVPLLMAMEDGDNHSIAIIVTPLNLLGKQNILSLQALGVSAVAVSSENVSEILFNEIMQGVYRVVVINPELLIGSRHVERIWTIQSFTSCLKYFVFDQAHCIKQWGKFRSSYLTIGALRYLTTESIPCYVASATLPAAICKQVIDILHLRSDNIEYIMYPNDQPDIDLLVRPIVHPIKTFKDLDFLIPANFKEGDPPPPKFLVFFDDTKEAERAICYLRTRLPQGL